MTSILRDVAPRPWRSRLAALHPKAYLWLHAAVGVLATTALVWAFAWIADEIPERSTLVRIDVAIGHWLETQGTDAGESVFVVVSWLGAPLLVACVALAIIVFAVRRDWLAAGAIALTCGGGVLLSTALKLVFDRGRPESAAEFITRHSWSFPSGHAMNSMICYGFLTLMILEGVTDRRARAAIIAAAAILVAAIGFSRLYLGVHYLSDVIGGWLAGRPGLAVGVCRRLPFCQGRQGPRCCGRDSAEPQSLTLRSSARTRMALRLYLLRHGQTATSRDNVFCGRGLDPALTPDGLAMARAFAEVYRAKRWTAIYSSPLERALTTAAPLARAVDVPIETRDGLAELDYGKWDGASASEVDRNYHDEYERWTADPAWNPPTGGETAIALAQRVMHVIEEIDETCEDGNVLVVSHKATIRVALCALLGVDVGRFRYRFGCPVGSVSIVEFGAHGPLAAAVADRSHLEVRLRELEGT